MKVVCRSFLWGKGTRGKIKKALMDWSTMTAKTVEGGLGIESFQQQSMALKMHWCSRLTMEDEVIWVKLAQESCARSLDKGAGCKTRRKWMTVEGLLLDTLPIVGSPLLWDIAKGLFEGRNALVFEPEGANLPMQMMIEQLLILFWSEEALTQQ